MTGQFNKRTYLTETEFSVCCAAAGIEKLPSFRFRSDELPGAPETGEALFGMQRRGLLRAEDGALVLEPELSGCFRAIKYAEGYVELYRDMRAEGPCCLLFASGDSLVSVSPGTPGREYAAVSRRGVEQMDEWLDDWGLFLPGNPEDDGGEDEAEEPEDAGLAEFLLRSARAGGDSWRQGAPEQVAACLDCRSIRDGSLRARLFLVHQSLTDLLVLGSGEDVALYRYSRRRLAELTEMLLREEKTL